MAVGTMVQAVLRAAVGMTANHRRRRARMTGAVMPCMLHRWAMTRAGRGHRRPQVIWALGVQLGVQQLVRRGRRAENRWP